MEMEKMETQLVWNSWNLLRFSAKIKAVAENEEMILLGSVDLQIGKKK